MKQILLGLCIVTSLFIISCNNNDLPPVIPATYYTNPYSGNYKGLFYEENNGVDSNGVFKDSSAYEYTMNIRDEGNQMIGFSKGQFVFDNILVDDSGAFTGLYIVQTPYIDSLGNPAIRKDTTDVDGRFTPSDSLYITYHSLSGSYSYPQWFVITHLSFVGKKSF